MTLQPVIPGQETKAWAQKWVWSKGGCSEHLSVFCFETFFKAVPLWSDSLWRACCSVTPNVTHVLANTLRLKISLDRAKKHNSCTTLSLYPVLLYRHLLHVRTPLQLSKMLHFPALFTTPSCGFRKATNNYPALPVCCAKNMETQVRPSWILVNQLFL